VPARSSHLRAPERKALGGDGNPCGSRTQGALQPGATHAYAAFPIGRETNYADETGLPEEPSCEVYPNPRKTPGAQIARAVLRREVEAAGLSAIARALRVSERTLRRYLNGGNLPKHVLAKAVSMSNEVVQPVLGPSLTRVPIEALLYAMAMRP
jgi:hypothetical protein